MQSLRRHSRRRDGGRDGLRRRRAETGAAVLGPSPHAAVELTSRTRIAASPATANRLPPGAKSTVKTPLSNLADDSRRAVLPGGYAGRRRAPRSRRTRRPPRGAWLRRTAPRRPCRGPGGGLTKTPTAPSPATFPVLQIPELHLILRAPTSGQHLASVGGDVQGIPTQMRVRSFSRTPVL